MINQNKKIGFTLIELLVVISIIGILASIVLASLNSARLKARDAKRLSDMSQMQLALELYYNQFNQYPDSDQKGCGTWDISSDGTFITPLVQNGFLPTNLSDPSLDNSNNSCGNYAYFRYPPGNASCDAAHGYFYILGVRVMESVSGTYPGSPGWSCPGRNWQSEFSWVTGRFER